MGKCQFSAGIHETSLGESLHRVLPQRRLNFEAGTRNGPLRSGIATQLQRLNLRLYRQQKEKC
jgi:hypothetical protein